MSDMAHAHDVARTVLPLRREWLTDKEVCTLLGYRNMNTLAVKRSTGRRVPASYGKGKARRTHIDEVNRYVIEMGMERLERKHADLPYTCAA